MQPKFHNLLFAARSFAQESICVATTEFSDSPCERLAFLQVFLPAISAPESSSEPPGPELDLEGDVLAQLHWNEYPSVLHLFARPADTA